MAETLQDSLRDMARYILDARLAEKAIIPQEYHCNLVADAATKLDELESRLSRHDTGREEMRKALFEADDTLRIAGAGKAVTIRLETKTEPKKDR